jgi:hypothetical protein
MSWRSRRLREDGEVPSLFGAFSGSLEAYLWGRDLRTFNYFGPVIEQGTFCDRLAKQMTGYSSKSLRDALDRMLQTEYGTSVETVFLDSAADEKVRTDGLFDLIGLLVGVMRRSSLDESEDEFTSFVNRLFARENQPFEVRGGRVQLAERPDEAEILTGLAALAPTQAIADDLKNAELAFYDPRDDRKDEGMLLIARAWDAAKQSDGDPKKTFEELLARSFRVPPGASPKALEAPQTLFDSIMKITNDIVRHGSPVKVEIATDEMKRHIFFEIASTVRLLYSKSPPEKAS